MQYEKVITSNDVLTSIPSKVSSDLYYTSAVFTYCAPQSLPALTGRYNYYITGPYQTDQIAFEPRVTTATTEVKSSVRYVTCNYLSGDFFYLTNQNYTGKVVFQVSNMSGTAHQGRSVILKISLGNATSAYFADVTSPIMTINTGTDYVSGTYYFIFANIVGTNIELVNFFKGFPTYIDTDGKNNNG